MFEFLITLAVLMVLAFPVVAIIALVRSIELRRLVFGLDARLRALEQGVAPGRTIAAPAAPPASGGAVGTTTSRRAGARSGCIASPDAAATARRFGAARTANGRRPTAITGPDQL